MSQIAVSIKDYFSKDAVKTRFSEIMGARSSAFISSVLSIVNQNEKLKQANPESIYMCAMMAATLDLPINSNLGFAYIIPYQDRDKGQIATFQLGYKAFIQLAQRSGQFKTISAAPIWDEQIVEANPLTGYTFDFSKKGTKIVGYAAYFALLNGFEKTLYMDISELQAHGKKYSQTFKSNFGLWKDNFDAMAQKTVIKLLLSKFAPLSVEMQKAIIADQSKVNNADTMDVEYIDNTGEPAEVSHEDLMLLFEMKSDALGSDDKEMAIRILTNKEVKSYANLHKKLAAI